MMTTAAVQVAQSSTATTDVGLTPLVLMLLLGAVTVLLVRNMRLRLKRLPTAFQNGRSADQGRNRRSDGDASPAAHLIDAPRA